MTVKKSIKDEHLMTEIEILATKLTAEIYNDDSSEMKHIDDIFSKFGLLVVLSKLRVVDFGYHLLINGFLSRFR